MAERLTKLLIANRGEIAVRIARTARRMGLRTVAVYSEADRGAVHVRRADEAVCIGEPAASASYLSIERILDAARRTGADAVHPGYGFLSENAGFARACVEAGITFVGPPAEAIERMGNKRAAKILMKAAGVACVPGFEGDDPSDGELIAAAAQIGFPIMVKAAAGGGGRGMRVVERAEDLPAALTGARAEAKSAFGDRELILERAVIEPRHVEVQIFADAHGHTVHLGERDCSVQRRHQKVIEECPSPAVDAPLRTKMGATAVDAARAVGYVGAGTVELILDRDGSFFFLEMNTRLQVEHPVTELCTGIDLVEWQLRVAAGEALPLRQEDIALQGHAIEARLYAEDPASGFMPQTGSIVAWAWPSGSDVRVDAGVERGSVVSAYYDPMLAKVIAHGSSRNEARQKLAAALSDATVMGVVTNKAFLGAIVEHPAFAAGEATTAFIGRHLAHHATREEGPPSIEVYGVAGLVSYWLRAREVAGGDEFIGWRSGGPAWSTLALSARGATAELRIATAERGAAGRRYRIEATMIGADGKGTVAPAREIEVAWIDDAAIGLVVDGVARSVRYARDGERIWIDDGTATVGFEDVTHQRPASNLLEGSGRVVAPLDGSVQAILVAAGDAVEMGRTVIVVEAMKMQHRIEADVTGAVAAVGVSVGQQVKTGQLLCEITPATGGA